MNKLAIVFPGQGSQYVGMGRKWFEPYTIARRLFEEANDILGFDLKKLIFEGSMADLTRTEITQPAILTVSMVAYHILLESADLNPSVLAGHSLGEITALTAAGALLFNDAVRLVHLRGKYMQDAASEGLGTMSAIMGVTKQQVEEVCSSISDNKGVVVPSNYNTRDQIVISGESQAVAEAGEQLTQLGARVIPLQVSAPFHSPLMEPAADRLREHLGSIQLHKLKYPVLSNVTGQLYENESHIVSLLTEQLTKPIQWMTCMQRMDAMGARIVIEAGPQAVLTQFIKASFPDKKTYAMDKEQLSEIIDEWNKSKPSVAFKPTTNVVTKCIAIAVCTRNRNWDNDEYNKGVVEPYRKVQKIQDELDQTGVEPRMDQMQEALRMLHSVFETKKVPMEERVERFNQVFEESGTRALFPDFDMTGAAMRG